MVIFLYSNLVIIFRLLFICYGTFIYFRIGSMSSLGHLNSNYFLNIQIIGPCYFDLSACRPYFTLWKNYEMGFMPLLIFFDAPIMHQGCPLPYLAAIHNRNLGTNLQFFKYLVKIRFFAPKWTFNYSRANFFLQTTTTINN